MPVKAEDCTLIVSTYNWPEALELSLLSILAQHVLPGELIIADDGSTAETRQLVAHYQQLFSIPLQYIWQEDMGFRLSQIRNKSVAAAKGKYILQIDGDVILHPKFVQDHLAVAREKALVQGSRVMLGPVISQKLLESKRININIFEPDIKRRENSLRIIPLSNYLIDRYKNRYPVYFARGANMAYWKEDFIAVNGYNESFEGWGHEDSDLTLRMMNNGVSKRYLKFAGIVYHLYHKESNTKENEKKNFEILQKTLNDKIVNTAGGVNQYLS